MREMSCLKQVLANNGNPLQNNRVEGKTHNNNLSKGFHTIKYHRRMKRSNQFQLHVYVTKEDNMKSEAEPSFGIATFSTYL